VEKPGFYSWSLLYKLPFNPPANMTEERLFFEADKINIEGIAICWNMTTVYFVSFSNNSPIPAYVR
jgi:hypothetical protein